MAWEPLEMVTEDRGLVKGQIDRTRGGYMCEAKVKVAGRWIYGFVGYEIEGEEGPIPRFVPYLDGKAPSQGPA